MRGLVLVAFAAFAGLHWMWLLEPTASGRAWQAVGIVVLVVLGLLGAARLPGALRQIAAALVAIAAIALALLAGGLADEQLRPDRWSDVIGGVGRGIEALPGVRVPYRGLDEWVRMVIGTGGTLLAVVAALLAFWPRRGRTGFPVAALLALVTLYAVPAVVLDFEGEFLRGALLALLMVAFLRVEKLRVRDVPAAGVAVVAAAIVALIAAPLLDGREPWWDYESWALETAGTRSVTFSWDHDYSPLDWPRDGRELLRVRARFPAYWKASDLDIFDGHTWRRDPRNSGERATAQLGDDVASRRRWMQEIEVTLRNLRTDSFVTAGIATSVRGEDGYPLGGGVFGAASGLGRGDSYEADVYTPQPTERQLRDAGNDYEDWLRAYTTLFVPVELDPAQGGVTSTERVTWPAFGTGGAPELDDAGDADGVPAATLLERSELGRVSELAQRLKQGTDTPLEYIERVEALPRRRLRLLRAAAAGGRQPRGIPARRQDRLLPAVLRRRGAAAADGRHPRAGRDRVHVGRVRRQAEGVRGARPRRPFLGRGLVPGLRLGHPRPDSGGGAAPGAARRRRFGAAERPQSDRAGPRR